MLGTASSSTALAAHARALMTARQQSTTLLATKHCQALCVASAVAFVLAGNCQQRVRAEQGLCGKRYECDAWAERRRALVATRMRARF